MNTFGRIFRVSIFGESHGKAIGVVLDGVRPGLPVSESDFMPDILRRKSGAKGTTPRTETDEPEILSGVLDGFTTGAPMTIVFRNGNTRPGDYNLFREVPRPGHADYTANAKWLGFNDSRGGGHFSGRLTLPIVAAGTVAKKMCGFTINARVTEVGGVSREKALQGKPDADKLSDSELWSDVLDKAISGRDSVGGIVECAVTGLPVGLGEPFFDSVESLVSHAIFSIPGVRGIEFGDGFAAARMTGSEHNDPLDIQEKVNAGIRGQKNDIMFRPSKNGAGGVNGGLTNGNPLIFRVAFKPTSSIGKTQETMNVASGQMTSLEIGGRHDACFALRTPPVVEAMTAIVLADLLGVSMSMTSNFATVL